MPLLLPGVSVAKDRTDPQSDPERDRFEFRGEPDWFARLRRQARRRGISVTAYIKQAASLQLEADEATDPQLRSGDAD